MASSSFIFGGISSDTTDKSIVFILSLPAFQWFRISNSTTEMRKMRNSHSCQVIGNRQMVVIGGINVQESSGGQIADIWTNGLGIFDMTSLKWVSMYNASAEPYVQPEPVKQHYING